MAEPIYAILCVPVAGDPGGLLRVGPSLQLLGPDIAVTRCAHPPRIVWHGSRSDALPLWWAGALVPEGVDRLHRAMLHEHWSRNPDAGAVLQMARQAEWDGLGRVVVLDLVDGVTVERAP